MTGIPHFEDLSAKRIYDSLDLNWLVSEKLDGSYLKFGLDEEGIFYTQRKGGQRTYTIEEWPDECWATTYKLAHTVAGMAIEALRKERLIDKNDWFGAEVIHGNLPNTVPYKIPPNLNGLLIITSSGSHVSEAVLNVLEKFICHFRQDVMFSMNGRDAGVMDTSQNWKIKLNPIFNTLWVKARLKRRADKLKRVLDHWFPRESKVEGFSIQEVLDINLSTKHPNCGDRNWNELRKELAKEREELREVFKAMVLLFKDILERVLIGETPSCIGVGSFKEGVVVKDSYGLFKIVNQSTFGEANRFTHIVKYWIVGGRRPARPSFLSRTKDWPIEKRLERLDALRVRFLQNHYPLHYTLDINGTKHLYSYSGDLKTRTLNMFCDTRKRIEDGR